MKRCLLLSAAILLAAQAQVIASDKKPVAEEKPVYDGVYPMREELKKREKAAVAQQPQPSPQPQRRSLPENLHHQNPLLQENRPSPLRITIIPETKVPDYDSPAHHSSPSTPVGTPSPVQAAVIHYASASQQPALQPSTPQATPAAPVTEAASQGQLVRAREYDPVRDLARAGLVELWIAGLKFTARGLYGLYTGSQQRQDPRPGNNN